MNEISLSLDETNLILKALSKLPYEEVFRLIANIAKQWEDAGKNNQKSENSSDEQKTD